MRSLGITLLAAMCTAAHLAACTESSDEPDSPDGDGGGGPTMDGTVPDGSATDAASSGAPMDGALADGATQPDAATGVGDAGPGECPAGASGSPPADYLAEFRSGSRLEARYWSAAGMPDVFAGFFDTELGVACDFARATDGELRCVPRAAARGTHLGFIDDQCSDAVWQTVAVCDSENAFIRLDTECSDTFAIARLEPLATSAVAHYGTSESCSASTDPLDPSATTFVAGAPLAPSAFVRGTLRELPGVCRASLRVVEAEDGAIGPHEVFDVERGAACDPTSATGTSACDPTRRAYVSSGLFTDDGCMEPAGTFGTWVDGPSCGLPDLISAAPDDGYYEVAGLHEDPLYVSTAACEPARDQPWIGAVFSLGDELGSDELAQFETALHGSGRLRVYAMGEDGTPLLAGRAGRDLALYDTMLSADCVALRFDDGAFRCVPADLFGTIGFDYEYNDDDCTQPIRRCSGDDCVGKVSFDHALDTAACATETVITAVWTVREPATGYFRNDGIGCMPAGTVGADQWQVDLVDWGTLATLQQRAAE